MSKTTRDAARSLYPRLGKPDNPGRQSNPRRKRISKFSTAPSHRKVPKAGLSNPQRQNPVRGQNCEEGPPIYASYPPAAAPIISSGFKGCKLPKDQQFDPTATVRDLEDRGFKLIKWDGRTYRPIIDRGSGIVLGALGGQPGVRSNRPRWDKAVARMNEILDAERMRMEAFLPGTEGHSTRGPFIALNAGYSHGGGRPQPTSCENSGLPERVNASVRRVVSDNDFNELASFISRTFRRCAPRLYDYYKRTTDAIETKLPDLRKPFDSSVFPTLTVNFGPHTACIPHRDSENLPLAPCGITALGKFNPTKGGHLVLWELMLVVEFPPGSTILIPSALITHSNIPISDTAQETRYSFTEYAAGELFRWVENDFQTHKQLFGDPPKEPDARDHYSKMGYANVLLSMMSVLSP